MIKEKGNTQVKAATLYTIGNIFNKAISLLLLPVFTKLLSTSSYGIVSTYNSWVTIGSVIIGLQLSMTLRTACTDYRDRLPSYISSMFSLTLLSWFVITGVTLLFRYFLFKDVPVILVVLCCVHAFMTAIIDLELQKEMMLVKYIKRTLLLALPNLIAAVVGIIIIVLFPATDYMGRIVSNCAVFVIFGLSIFTFYVVRGKTFYSKEFWGYGLALSLPLIFHGLAVNVLSNIDKTMLTAMRSASETGIYSVAYTIGMAIMVITSSLESVWIPWFTNKMEEGDKASINTSARTYILGGTVICVAAMLVLPEVLKLFSDESYWEGVIILPPIVLASFVRFLYSISVDVEYYYKATKRIAINTVIAAGLNLLLNFIFIPKYGAVAAAYTTVASYAVSYLIHYFGARNLDKDLFAFGMYIIPILVVIAGTVMATLLIDVWIARWAVAVVLGIATVIVFIKMGGLKLLKKNACSGSVENAVEQADKEEIPEELIEDEEEDGK